jgi:predicted phage-related endonuclease
VRELERIPASVCEYIVEVWAHNGDPMSALTALVGCGVKLEAKDKERIHGEVPDEVQPLVDELVIIKKQLDILDAREKEIRKALLDTMTLAGEDKWSSDLITISRRAESERVSIDTKALQKSEPDIYEKFKKVTKVAASLTYKVL